jgi:hypothetical protein
MQALCSEVTLCEFKNGEIAKRSTYPIVWTKKPRSVEAEMKGDVEVITASFKPNKKGMGEGGNIEACEITKKIGDQIGSEKLKEIVKRRKMGHKFEIWSIPEGPFDDNIYQLDVPLSSPFVLNSERALIKKLKNNKHELEEETNSFRKGMFA